MKYFELDKEKLSSLWPMWLVTMLVAAWSIYIQDGNINRDGLLYLKQAYLIAEGNWEEGLALYPWPFFSILIAVFHKITNLHLQVVAHGVDLTLFGLATLFYLKTLQLIHNQEKSIIFYGGVILLSFIPIMDDYVGMVLRDHGLWAGCMIGTYFYFKNLKEYSLKNSVIWQFGFLFAGLFRPEGLVFLVLLPFWNIIQKKSKKFKQLVKDFSLSIFFILLCLFVILSLNIDLINIISSSRLTEFLSRLVLFFNQLVKPLPIQTDNKYLFNLLENYSLIITYAVLLSVLIFKWIKGLGVLHGSLFFYSFYSKKKSINEYQKHIYLFLILSFILVSINLFNVYVLTNRYWGFHWWWVFILITPVVLNLLKLNRTHYLIKGGIKFFILFLIFNGLIDRSDNLEQETAEYIRKNQLTNIDYGHNLRIKYYVNYKVLDLMQQSSAVNYKYKLIKIHDEKKINSKRVVKKFPDQEPKFLLIKNAQ